MKALALLLLLPVCATAQTIDIKRIGASACECQTAAGVRISGHTSDLEAIDACADTAFRDGLKKRLVCTYELSVTKPAVTPPPPVTGNAVLTWTPPTLNVDGSPLTDLASFRIYCGTAPDALSVCVPTIPAGQLTYTMTDLSFTTWYFAMTAINAAGVESQRTNIASKVVM